MNGYAGIEDGSMKMVINISNITKTYTKNKHHVTVLDNINHKFSNNNMYLIKGASGAGKSTLLSVIGLLDSATSGDIYFGDTCVSKLNSKKRNELRKKEIGFVFQEAYLFEGLTIEENIKMSILGEEEKVYTEKIEALLCQVGLQDRKDAYPFELSGGEKQRISFVRAMVKNPSILICDEPTSNLDEENSKIIVSMLSSMKEAGGIVIVSSHTSIFDATADEIIPL